MIALIYEGPKAEYNIFNNIKKVFFTDDTIVKISLDSMQEKLEFIDASYGGNIFDFYNSFSKDQDMDIIAFIQERIRNNTALSKKYSDFLKYDRSMFSEIYLFFDFEIHHNLNYGNKNRGIEPQKDLERKILLLEAMLNLFSNETENGKLYLSYPMIESLRDIKKNNVCCDRCCEALVNLTSYKAIVHEATHDFSNYGKLSLNEWVHFVSHALQKANCVVNKKYEVVDYKNFISDLTQKKIFDSQVDVCKKQSKVFILNGVSLFLLEYFGSAWWGEEGFINRNVNMYRLSSPCCTERE